MNRFKLSELASRVAGEVSGDGEKVITGVADLAGADAQKISFCVSSRGVADFPDTAAGALVVPLDFPDVSQPLIRVKDPVLAIALIHQMFIARPFQALGVSPMASVAADVVLPSEVSIHPMAVVGSGVRLGERVTIHPGVVLQDGVIVGDDCVLHPNVTVYSGCTLGNRVVVHGGTVIGADGFGYATTSEGEHIKRPQVGTVVIEDDVELGANVCVDCATFGVTKIGRGTKVDNMVQIAHNVELGPGTIMVSQSGVAGSSKLGRNVVVGGQVGISGHIELGDGVMVGAKSGVHNSQKAGAVVSGVPAVPHKKWLRASTSFVKLPELIREVRLLKKEIAALRS